MVPPSAFIGRRDELAALHAAFTATAGELIMLWGRRRVGKTALLQQAVGSYNALFYQATRQTEAQELRAFTEAYRALFDDLPADYAFQSWDAALTTLGQHAVHERLIVVLDEFPYLEESTPALASILQRWWDGHGSRLNIAFVLCGSAQTVMAGLDHGDAPLHLRFTRKIRLRPLSYMEAAEFTPQLAAEDKAKIYCMLGGTPIFLRAWDADESFEENVYRLFGDSGSPLIDAATLILQTDLGDAASPYRALSAAAHGLTKRGEIINRAGISNERTLHRLEELELLERRTPATDQRGSRRSIYQVTDSYLRFWFRFIESHREDIDRGFGRRFVDSIILKQLDDFMGFGFEEIARAFAGRLMFAGTLDGLRVGSWWSADGKAEIDIVGTSSDAPTFIGTVKWSRALLGRSVYENVFAHAQSLGVSSDIPWLLIGRSGVDQQFAAAHPYIMGFSVEDLYRDLKM